MNPSATTSKDDAIERLANELMNLNAEQWARLDARRCAAQERECESENTAENESRE